jgi:hypothetical protein
MRQRLLDGGLGNEIRTGAGIAITAGRHSFPNGSNETVYTRFRQKGIYIVQPD